MRCRAGQARWWRTSLAWPSLTCRAPCCAAACVSYGPETASSRSSCPSPFLACCTQRDCLIRTVSAVAVCVCVCVCVCVFRQACAPASTTHMLLTWRRAQGILEVERSVEAPAAPRSHEHWSKGAGEQARVAGKRGRPSKDLFLGQPTPGDAALRFAAAGTSAAHGVGSSSVMEDSGGGSAGGSGSRSMNGSGPRRDQGGLSDMDCGHL